MEEKPSARLVNTTIIESTTGLRSINLFQGDICFAKDELLVISSHAGYDNQLTGMVVDALTAKFSLNFSRLSPILTMERFPLVGTFRLQSDPPGEKHPFKEILVVRIPGFSAVESYGTDPLSVYEEAVWTLFGSLAAWEQKGLSFKGMAMPLLAGKRGYPEQLIMQVLLRQSTSWLKSSRGMSAVNLYLFDNDQIKVWNDAMNSVLGRRSINSAKNEVVKALREETLVLIENSGKYHGKHLAEVIKPMKDILLGQEICLQLVAALGRSLVEKIVHTIMGERGLEIKDVLAQDIQTLSYQQVVAPWIVNHMHALRVFGNETLHAKAEVSYRPETLQDDDLVSVLASLRSVVQFYANW